MSKWNYILRRVEKNEMAAVEKLKCPSCGGSLILSYGKVKPSPIRKTKKNSFLSVICKECLDGITCDGVIDEPPWAKTCGGRLETTPRKTKKE